MREKLNDRFAAAVPPGPQGKIERYFDTTKLAPQGFLLRVTPAGARAWCLQYRVKDSQRQREITIGDIKSWPISKARERGHELRRVIDTGGDPLADREVKRAAPSVADLVSRFQMEAFPSRAPGTQAEYASMLRHHIVPALGRLKVTAVTNEDVERLHHKITQAGKSRRANAVKSLVATLFAQAIVWKMCSLNPATGVKSNKEPGRERYLTPEEVERLVKVLDVWRKKERASACDSFDAIMLALLTGARRGEILSMAWTDLDLTSGTWVKPAHLVKQRRLHRVPLSEAALEVLRRRRVERDAGTKVVRLRDDFVFRGGGSKTHCNLLERDWYQIRALAGLEDVRFHDLRHNFASHLVSAGQSLAIIGRMLGHSRAQTTMRYSHLADQPLREAAAIVSRIVRGK
jgi:integrase